MHTKHWFFSKQVFHCAAAAAARRVTRDLVKSSVRVARAATLSAMPEAPRPLPTPDPPQHTAFPPLNSSTHGVPHCAVAGRFAIMLSLATAALALAGGVVEEVKPSNGMVRGGKITEC